MSNATLRCGVSQPLPARLLRHPLEMLACLRGMQQANAPLFLYFPAQQQRFRSLLIDVDTAAKHFTLDELLPRHGQSLLAQGLPFEVSARHEGVQVCWQQPGQSAGRLALPEFIEYHQRRNAYRAPVLHAHQVQAELQEDQIRGSLADISATGCRMRLAGELPAPAGGHLRPFRASLPVGAVSCEVEIRHYSYDEKLDSSFLGLSFSRLNAGTQRLVERYVHQLQREAMSVRPL